MVPVDLQGTPALLPRARHREGRERDRALVRGDEPPPGRLHGARHPGRHRRCFGEQRRERPGDLGSHDLAGHQHQLQLRSLDRGAEARGAERFPVRTAAHHDQAEVRGLRSAPPDELSDLLREHGDGNRGTSPGAVKHHVLLGFLDAGNLQRCVGDQGLRSADGAPVDHRPVPELPVQQGQDARDRHEPRLLQLPDDSVLRNLQPDGGLKGDAGELHRREDGEGRRSERRDRDRAAARGEHGFQHERVRLYPPARPRDSDGAG